jgi:hypothetical protein
MEPAQHLEFQAINDAVEDLEAFPYFEYVENITDCASEPLPPLPRTEIYPGAGTSLINSIAEPLERDAQGCLETNVQNIPYYPFATHEEYNYIQCGIMKKGMKTYYDSMLKEENTAIHFPCFKNGDGLQMVVASMPDDQALGEWELHTLKDMRWHDNDKSPTKYWSRDIIKSMRWLMRQPAYTEHHISPPSALVLQRYAPETPLYRNAHCGLVVGDTGNDRRSRIILC